MPYTPGHSSFTWRGAASGNRITVTMRDPPGADMSKLQKGSVVTIAAKLRDFTGVQNEYVTLEDGTCKDCR